MVIGARDKWMLAVGSCGLWLLAATACGTDLEEGSQYAGHRCLVTDHCVQGLVCDERRCVPVTSQPADTGVVSDGGDTSGAENCEVGTRTCVGRARVRICRQDGPVVRPCRGDVDTVCRDGQCVPGNSCTPDSDRPYCLY